MANHTEDTPAHLQLLSGPLLHTSPDASRFVHEAEATAVELGLHVFTVGLAGVAAKPQLLQRFASAMSFPSHFGQNWDALLDCLRDLSWVSGHGYVLILKGFDEFFRASPKDAQTLAEVIASAARFWRERGHPFFALMTTSSAAPSLPGIAEEACHHV